MKSSATISLPPRPRAILDAAFRHLVDRGFEGLRIREIAEEVGINQATLLYHFPDKEELIVALIDDIVERLRSRNVRRETSFEEYFREFGELFCSSPEIFIALNEISTRAVRHPKIARTIASYQQDWRRFLRTLLEKSAPGATAPAVDSATSCAVVFAEGLRAHASSSGRLATLAKRGKGCTDAVRDIRAQIETFCALVRAGFGN